MAEIARETLERHRAAFERDEAGRETVDSGGAIHYRRFSEGHRMGPEAIAALQQAVRHDDEAAYDRYAALVNDEARSRCTLRGLFGFVHRDAVPIEEVEPVESIVQALRHARPCRSGRSARRRTRRWRSP